MQVIFYFYFRKTSNDVKVPCNFRELLNKYSRWSPSRAKKYTLVQDCGWQKHRIFLGTDIIKNSFAIQRIYTDTRGVNYCGSRGPTIKCDHMYIRSTVIIGLNYNENYRKAFFSKIIFFFWDIFFLNFTYKG